jgi:hypothetical protein
MRKFRLIDNNSPIKIAANLGELGIEIENHPLTKVWNQKEEIRQFRFIAVEFQYSGLQMVSEIQLEEIPENIKIEFLKREP